MMLLKPICVGFSTILVFAALTPVAICHKPYSICLLPPHQEVNSDAAQNNQNLECEYVQNSPLMTTYTSKKKKYDYVPVSIIYEPYFARTPAISLPSIPSYQEGNFRIVKVPSEHKTLTNPEDKTIRHVPVVQKVTKNVVETRTQHIPVIRHRLRTVVEKYTEHVPVTQTITRPIVDTIVKHIPVVEPKKRGHPHRIKEVPSEQRVVNELYKLRHNSLYKPGLYGLSYLYPKPYYPGYCYPFTKTNGLAGLNSLIGIKQSKQYLV